mgnify:CR=1 FL=1
MCIRDSSRANAIDDVRFNISIDPRPCTNPLDISPANGSKSCLLYTSDAADERSSVDLGGRRIIKKKKRLTLEDGTPVSQENYR